MTRILVDEKDDKKRVKKQMNWFTVEKIDSKTFAISEYKHWEETHCYLLVGNEKALLIDTGLGISNIKKVVNELTSLPILVATTHAHWDHIGGHKYFENTAVHEYEKSWLSGEFPLPLEVVKKNLLCNPCEFPDDFNINDFEIFKSGVTVILHDNDIIDLGERKIKVIHTPGHSPGHCCFYEADKKYLYSGDLIYSGCLDAFYPTTDPYDFWQSVKKVQKLSINKILPAHHKLNVSNLIISEIDSAFSNLYKNNKLEQGAGIFDFGNFKIHI